MLSGPSRLCWGATMVILVCAQFAKGQNGPTMQTIANKWRERQKSIQSARLAWVHRETIPKGAVSRLLLSLPPSEQKRGTDGPDLSKEIPPVDTTHDVALELCIHGDKVRHTMDDRQWSPSENRFVIKPVVQVFDGKEGKLWRPDGAPTTPYPQGVLQRRNPIGSMIYLAPLVMSLQPFSPAMRLFELDTLKLSGHTAIIGGRPCLELQHDARGRTERVWIDPSREYQMVRYWSTAKDKVWAKVDIEYGENPVCRWIPRRWTIVTFDKNGALSRSQTANLTSCELNVPIDDAEFALDFSPGTAVLDFRRQPTSQFIVRENGSARPVLPREAGLSYDELVHSSPGLSLGAKVGWCLVGVGMLLAGATVVYRGRVITKRVVSIFQHSK